MENRAMTRTIMLAVMFISTAATAADDMDKFLQERACKSARELYMRQHKILIPLLDRVSLIEEAPNNLTPRDAEQVCAAVREQQLLVVAGRRVGEKCRTTAEIAFVEIMARDPIIDSKLIAAAGCPAWVPM